MKRLMLIGLIAAIAGAAWGQQATPDPYADAAALLKSAAAINLASVTGDDVKMLLSQLSVAVQRTTYVQRIRRASMMVPGLGELKTGDTVGGVLLMSAHVAVAAGTLLGAYFLLPGNVRFGAGGLDYLGTPIQNIETTWESNSLRDYLPSIGALAGGMVLQHVLRFVSAAHAAREARANLAAGKVTFEPRLDFGSGGMMMGMGMRW